MGREVLFTRGLPNSKQVLQYKEKDIWRGSILLECGIRGRLCAQGGSRDGPRGAVHGVAHGTREPFQAVSRTLSPISQHPIVSECVFGGRLYAQYGSRDGPRGAVRGGSWHEWPSQAVKQDIKLHFTTSHRVGKLKVDPV
jgi:hypothetical protein